MLAFSSKTLLNVPSGISFRVSAGIPLDFASQFLKFPKLIFLLEEFLKIAREFSYIGSSLRKRGRKHECVVL